MLHRTTTLMVSLAHPLTQFHTSQFKLKKFEDRDVDIAVDCCGVCGSDVHTINGGWGDCPLPICVGHEVVGKAVKVGKDVKTIKVGDRVGVGAQIGADLTCGNCKADQENYCPNQIDTYGAPSTDGTITQGGYSSHVRAHEYFTFKIPDNIESEVAAPMLCAGLTGESRNATQQNAQPLTLSQSTHLSSAWAPDPARKSPSSASEVSATSPSSGPLPSALKSTCSRTRRAKRTTRSRWAPRSSS